MVKNCFFQATLQYDYCVGWQVDQAILSEEDKVVMIRFGHDWVQYSFFFTSTIIFTLRSLNV